MVDWKSLPAFLAVARAGSLRGAAEQTGGTHATLRRQVEALEAQLGVQLFRRGSGGLALSAAGRKLLPQALEAEAALRQGFNAVRGLDSEAAGRIRLSADPMTAHYLLAPILGEFLALYPDIHLDMTLSYGIDSIDRHETDVSIRHVREVTGEAVGRKLFPLSIGVMASRAYLDRHLHEAGPRGEGLTWLGYGTSPEMQAMIATSPFPRATVRHAIADPAMHMHLARAGAGMTVLAAWVQSVFPELQRVPGTELDRSRATWVLMHGDLRRVKRVRLFVDFLYESLLERRADVIG